MMAKIDMTDRDFIENDLLVSGYTAGEVSALTRYLDGESGTVTAEWMRQDSELEVAHSLCQAWLVRRLRALAESSDQRIAMAALEQLVKISLCGQI
jgi:hypothetical protein